MKLDLRESQQAHRLARKGRQQELRDNMQAAAGKSFDSLRRDFITAEHEETHRAESRASLHGQPRVELDMRMARPTLETHEKSMVIIISEGLR